MEKFKERLLKNKCVSVWGMGYLGYTEIIKLQSKGYHAKVFDYTDTGFAQKVKNHNYPETGQVYSWSINGRVPAVDFKKITLARKPDEMFGPLIHILAFPAVNRENKNLLKALAGVFLKNRKKLDGALVIFLSAGVPGAIDRHFISTLKSKCDCAFVSSFRSDWTVEEFLSDNKKMILAADNQKSLDKAKFFYDTLGINFKVLTTIKEAELYENAKNTLQYVTTMFINQLSFAYPETNVRQMTKYLLDDVRLNESHLSIGAGGSKIPVSVENILRGSKNPNHLSLVNETQQSNTSLILNYAEIIEKMKCRSVTIMGISIRGGQKSIELSPSLVIAEYLHNRGIKVYVDDPLYNKATIKKLIPFSKPVDILREGLKSDAIFVMTDHNRYKYLIQGDVDSLKINKAKLVIDNLGLFKDFKFSNTTIYHLIGDGNLGKII